jgi:hypothetical protein
MTVRPDSWIPSLIPTWNCPGARLPCLLLTLAAMVLQADPPVITSPLSMQLCMDPRDEARLLLGPQGHIAQVGPAAQPIGAASPGWRVEGVEITAPAASYAQQLEAGQHGRCPSHHLFHLRIHHLSHYRTMHLWLKSSFSVLQTSCAVYNFTARVVQNLTQAA